MCYQTTIISYSSSLASWRPIYTAAIMPFQHTWGEKGLAHFTYNCVLPDQSDSTTQICGSINAYLLGAEGQAQRLTAGMG